MRSTSSDLAVLQYIPQDKPLNLAQTAKFQRTFEIINQSRNPYPGGHFEVDKGQPFYQFSHSKIPQIGPGETTQVTVEMRIQGVKKLQDIPRFFGVTIDSTKIMLEEIMYDWMGEIQSIYHHGSRYLNILLFGMAGSTKSSFINSVYTLLNCSPVDLMNPAKAGGADSHVTTAIGRYQFEHFRLYDVWGLTTKNYQGKELDYILDGKLPVNWDMKKVPDELLLQKGCIGAHERRIHCVLFFMPQSTLNDPNQVSFRNLVKQNYEFISKKANLNPILILSRVDEVCSEIRSDHTKNKNDIEALKKKAATLLNIPQNRIFHNLNYTLETKKTFIIDVINSIILEQALKSAHSYVEYTVSSEEKKDDEGYEW